MSDWGVSLDKVGARIADERDLESQAKIAAIDSVMSVAIVGSRRYPELDRVDKLIDRLAPDATVISGGAVGVDHRAANRAYGRNMLVAEVKPLMPIDAGKNEARRRLMGRNTVIVRASDIVVAFWDGASNGTADSIRKALDIHGFCIVALPGQPPQVWVPR